MFKQIDIKTHPRYEYLKHFTKSVPCTYSLCVDMNVTNIKNFSFKTYPVMIYLISKVLNCHGNFKMSFDKDQNFGIFDLLSPSYTILNDDKSFSNIYTEFTDDFSLFYENALKDMQKYKNKSAMFPQKSYPENLFNISALPWVNFTSFNLNLQNGYNYLLSIFTIGKFTKKDGKYLLPLSLQVHYGTTDGCHVGLFWRI